MTTEDQWEVEIRIRRNGRCVGITKARGDTPGAALWNATTDLSGVESANCDGLTGAEMARLVREASNG